MNKGLRWQMATSVATFAELKTAIEDASVSEILVTADIEFLSGGLKIDPTKSFLIIDFGGHKVTDYNSLSFTDGLYIPSTKNSISVTVKNAVWSGRNYYGVVGVYDGNSNTAIHIENITYTGPQFIYNKSGMSYVYNCDVTISKNGSSTNAQEFCEGNRLTFSGNVKIESYAQSDAVIWFTNTGASFTVEENATLSIRAELTYLLYTDVSPVMKFMKNSSTTIVTKNGLFYASGSSTHIASSFLVEESASFVATQIDSNSVPMFKCSSVLILSKNSTFHLYSETISSTPLLYFGQTADIRINSPKSVILYNRGGDIFKFQTGSESSPNALRIVTTMLRLWNVAKSPLSSAGTFDNPPTSEIYKADYAEEIALDIFMTTSKITSISNNLVLGDKGYPLLATSINLITSKVLSMGDLALDVNAINDVTTAIMGNAESEANMKISYGDENLTAVADENGAFDVPLESALDVGTTVTVSTNKNFLTKTLNFAVDGSVTITKIDDLNFYAFTSPSSTSIIYRQSDFGLEITDSRATKGEWYLYAYILSPLKNGDEMLEDSLIFKDGEDSKILTDTPLLVYTGNGDEIVSWQALEGFLLSLEPQKEYVAGNYTTSLLWQVSPAKL